MGNIGLPELAIVLVVVLLIFGPKRLPGIGRSLGSSMREFRDSITGRGGDDEDEDAPRRPTELPAATPAPAVPDAGDPTGHRAAEAATGRTPEQPAEPRA